MDNTDQIEAVRKMQGYIMENLENEITLNDLARTCGYSPWYSAKIFKVFTNKTPFEYIRLCRLTEAAKVFKEGGKKIIDVAFDFHFNSHEGFTRAFSKQFGINPKQYSIDKPPIKYFIPYPVSEYNSKLAKGEFKMKNQETKKNSIIFTQVVEKTARKLILKRGIKAKEYFEYCEEVGCDIWGILSSIHDCISEPMGLWLPENKILPDTSKYVQGVEVSMDYIGQIPGGFEMITLEPCKIMIFQGPIYNDDNFVEAIEIVEDAIDEYNPNLYGFEWADEDAPRFQYEPQGSRGYIEGRPVRLLK